MLGERSIPYPYLVHKRKVASFGYCKRCSFQYRYIRFGYDGCTLAVEIEGGSLATYHIECHMMPAGTDFRGIGICGYGLRFLTIIEDEVMQRVVTQAEALCLKDGVVTNA